MKDITDKSLQKNIKKIDKRTMTPIPVKFQLLKSGKNYLAVSIKRGTASFYLPSAQWNAAVEAAAETPAAASADLPLSASIFKAVTASAEAPVEPLEKSEDGKQLSAAISHWTAKKAYSKVVEVCKTYMDKDCWEDAFTEIIKCYLRMNNENEELGYLNELRVFVEKYADREVKALKALEALQQYYMKTQQYENTTRRVSMRILVIEDERALCETIVRSLKRLAYSVDFCYDGNKANELLGMEKYDLVLLDLNLPGADGMTVLRTLRQTDKDTGVLILSARCEVADKVEGLDAGANDYLTKPFHLEELEARIRSLTRRRFTQNNVVLNCGKVAFDTKARVAVADGQELSLTRKEIGILEYLLLNQGRPVSQEELLDHVWDNSVDNFSNSIRVHISALRKKLRAALGYDPIRNRIGEGYVMEEEKV